MVPQRHHSEGSRHPRRRESLRLSLWNALSLRNKIPELESFVGDHLPHLLAITETWLNTDTFDAEIALPSYHIVRKDRFRDRRGGGVLLYVSSALPFALVPLSPSCTHLSTIDMIACVITLPSGPLVVITVYRSPTALPHESDALLQECTRLSQLAPDCLLLGDFNCPGVDWVTGIAPVHSFGATLLSMADDCLLHQVVSSPTRYRDGHDPSLLDLIFSKHPSLVRTVQVSSPLGRSDHAIVDMIYDVASPPHRRPLSQFRPNPHKMDLALLQGMAQGIRWTLPHGTSIDHQWAFLGARILQASSACVPLTSQRYASNKPYYTRRVKRATQRRRRAWRLWAMSRTLESLQLLKQEQRRSRRILRCARQQFEWQLSQRAKSAPKVLFAHVNRTKRVAHDVTSLQRQDGSTATFPGEVCEIFKDAFSSVYRTDSGAAIPPLPAPTNIMPDPFFTEEDVLRALQQIDNNKSPGPDGHFPRLLHELAPFLAAPLTDLFNESLRTGTTPAQWKEAIVRPIPKQKDSSNPLDFRPISLTSVICKVMEGLIRSKIHDHLKDVLSPQQHGFLPRRSCLSNLLAGEEIITSILNRGDDAVVLFLDFAKAFDSVNHRFLLAKMAALGISPVVIRWVECFLTDRTFRVQVGDHFSAPAPVPSGVPQGTVLGPLLFILYVNDLAVSLGSSGLFYADDIKLIVPGGDPLLSQQLLDNVVAWSSLWDLPLNAAKCQHLFIGKGQPPPPPILHDPSGAVHPLKPAIEVRDLGIMIDSNLFPSCNVQYAAQKARRM